MQRKPLRAGVAMLALTAVASVAPGTTAPAQEAAPPRPSLNLYGVTGLIDMPSAESQPDAQLSASYSQFGETSRRNFTFQLLPRVSGTLRYSTISDWGNDEDPDYNLFDRSFDLQFQLLKEQGLAAVGGARLPRPPGHRGLFLRVSCRDQDRRAGLHRHRRRRLGAAGQRRRGGEPVLLGRRQLLHPRDRLRRGGNVELDALFHGEKMGFFGGVEWRTPIDKLTLKAEISSDAYTREQAGPEAEFERKSPINVGAEYRLTRASRSAATTCTARPWASTSWCPATPTSR